MAVTRGPDISVVVPSHDRPLQLRWLLNGLEDQTLERERFEVVVAHDSSGPETEELLRTHPLAKTGSVHGVALPPGSAPPGKNRNAGWRRAGAPLVLFTDDDCRPHPEWLEQALAAAERHPGAIVQGRTEPDPHQVHLLSAPHARTQKIHPPVPNAQGCNILYPRALLEESGGFDERLHSGEDTDCALRVREAGADYVGAPDMLTYHAVVTPMLPGRLRSLLRWRDLPTVIKRHPQLREGYPLAIFWRETHMWFPVAVAGAILERRNPLFAVLGVPWLVRALPYRGHHPRGRIRSLTELPARAAVDAAELAVLAWGSARSRTLFL
jgi:GT2 family glycosyltransferase